MFSKIRIKYIIITLNFILIMASIIIGKSLFFRKVENYHLSFNQFTFNSG